MLLTESSRGIWLWLEIIAVFLPPLFGAGIFFLPHFFFILLFASIVSLWLALFLSHRIKGGWQQETAFFSFLALCLFSLESLFLFVERGERQIVFFVLLAAIILVGVRMYAVLHVDPLSFRRRGFKQLITALLFLSLYFFAVDAANLRIFLRVELWLTVIFYAVVSALLSWLYLGFFTRIAAQKILGSLLTAWLAAEFFWITHFLPTNPVLLGAIVAAVLFFFLITFRDFLNFSLKIRSTVAALLFGAVGIGILLITGRWQ